MTAKIGAYESPNASLDAYSAADALYGYKVPFARTYWDLDADMLKVKELSDSGRTVVVSFALAHHRFEGYSKARWLEEIAVGQHDDILTKLGQGLAALNAPVYATLMHEPDMDVDHGEYDVGRWSAGFRRFHDVIKPLAPKARLGPIFTGWFARDHYEEWKPGHINFVGIDPYCWPASWVDPWTMLDREVPQVRSRWPRKSLLVCETACPPDPDKPAWIEALPDALAWHSVHAALWFDVAKMETSGTFHDWRINTDPKSLAAFRSIVQ